jgi:aminoglycoside phosphotransferase (APT) family kinase protein
VPSPRVLHVLQPQDGSAPASSCSAVEGETIARKILRDEKFAKARPTAGAPARQGRAGIHGLPLAKLPKLRADDARTEIAELERDYRSLTGRGRCSNWRCAGCASAIPGPSREVTLVHATFATANLIIGPDGVRAVLDWELAHSGDPMEDLGWVCVNSWRFGEIDKAGRRFGTREELFAGYEAAGRRVDPDRVKFWK